MEAQVIEGREMIDLFRLITLRSALSLEMKGMVRRGKSAYQIIKDELGLKGNKAKVFLALENFIKLQQGICNAALISYIDGGQTLISFVAPTARPEAIKTALSVMEADGAPTIAPCKDGKSITVLDRDTRKTMGWISFK